MLACARHTAEGAEHQMHPSFRDDDPDAPPPPRARPPRRIAPLWIFLTFWFVATFYFWGDLGKWLDDWGAHVRSADSGGFAWSDVFALDYFGLRFWRPLHIRFVVGLQTIFWNHDWVSHFITAALHGLNAFLVWRVLRRLCVSVQAPIFGALTFLTFPAGYEAVFWLSTLGTGAGLAHLLVCTLAVQRFASGERPARSLWLHLPVLLLVPWWYEQPAAAAPALAFAYLACARDSTPLRSHLLRAALIGLVAAASAALYMLVMKLTAIPGVRGAEGSFVTPSQFLPQCQLILRQATDHLLLRGFAVGALEEGWRAFWSRPRQAWITLAVLAFAVWRLGRWWTATPRRAFETNPHQTARTHGVLTRFSHAASLGFGLALAIGAIVPAVLISDQWFSSRLTYLPALGIIIALTTLADPLLARGLGRSSAKSQGTVRSVFSTALLLALLIITGTGSIMLVGVQSAWNKLSLRDRQVAAQLRALVPHPTPGTFYLPVLIRGWPIKTSDARFNTIASGPLEALWSAQPYVQMTIGRSDVYATAFNRWLPPRDGLIRVHGATTDGLVVDSSLFERHLTAPKQSHRRSVIPWDKVVAFELHTDRVTPIGSLRIVWPEAPGHVVFIPLRAVRNNSNRHLGGPSIDIKAFTEHE